MGFLDFLENALNSIERMMTSESMQKTMNKKLEEAAQRAERAERDYDAGRISFEQYSAIIDSAAKTLDGHLQYQKLLDNYEKKRNGR